MQIAYLGYPYTFVSRDVEAAPTHIVQFDTGGLLMGLVQARFFLELCEAGRAQNRGIHRLSPQAQRFVYRKWVSAMKDRIVDIRELFGHELETLSSAQDEDWFVAKTEPQPSSDYKPVQELEEMIDNFIRSGCFLKTQD